MAGSTISNLVTITVTLGNGSYPSPLTIAPTGAIKPHAAGATGIVANVSGGAILNRGSIVAGGAGAGGTGGFGVDMAGGGLTNDGSIVGGGGGHGGTGVDITSGSSTNNGTIDGGQGLPNYSELGRGGSGGAGVSLDASSILINSGLIMAGSGGVAFSFGGYGGAGGIGVDVASSRLANYGMIAGGSGGEGGPLGEGGSGGLGVTLSAGSTLTNHGRITGGDGNYEPGRSGFFFAAGGNAVAATTSILTNDGTIIGGASGFDNSGGSGIALTSGIVINNGFVGGGGGGGLPGGAYASYGGVGAEVVSSSLTNNGTIAGSVGDRGGAGIDATSSSLTNNGTVTGGNYGGAGVLFHGGGTLVNAGLIGGGTGYYGVGIVDAVDFGTGASRLILEPGARFSGDVVAQGPPATLELASTTSAGTIAGIGTSFSGFGIIDVDTRATWLATSSITGSGTMDLGAGGNLTLDGGVDATWSVHFTSETGTLGLGHPADFAPAVYGLQAGDAIDFTSITSAGSVTAGVDASNHLTLASNGAVLAEISLDPAQSFVGRYFNPMSDGGSGTVVTESTSPPCFLLGTLITTPSGEVPVERLSVGDMVVTTRSEVRPIVWIGTGRVLATRGRRSAATPVIVRKGALANNVPHHDLHVTKGHSLLLDGVLIPVEHLVNHRSIIWDERAREVTIYHIELETHDVLIADGAPAESYRDDGNRWQFRNANSGWCLPPQPPCAPVLTGGPIVDAVWRQLVDRIASRNGPPLTHEPDLHLLVDGKRIDSIRQSDSEYAFRFTATPRNVRIRSRAGVPQEVGIERDERALGVALRRIVLAQPLGQRAIDAKDTSLTDGFYEFEADHNLRWTTGDAAIPIELFAGVHGPCMLMLQIGATAQYIDQGDLVTERVA